MRTGTHLPHPTSDLPLSSQETTIVTRQPHDMKTTQTQHTRDKYILHHQEINTHTMITYV